MDFTSYLFPQKEKNDIAQKQEGEGGGGPNNRRQHQHCGLNGLEWPNTRGKFFTKVRVSKGSANTLEISCHQNN